MSRKKLGRGLSALLGNTDQNLYSASTDVDREEILNIPLSDIHMNPQQPRKYFDDLSLQELAHSIQDKGVLQPLLIRRREIGGFELIAGERRYRALQSLQIEHAPCRQLKISSNESVEVALLENIQRQNLDPLEEAEGYHTLLQKFDYTQEMLAHRLGKSRTHITNLLRLRHLPESIQTLIREQKLTMGHAKLLVNAEHPEQLAETIVSEGLNVRQTENFLRQQPKKKSIKSHRGMLINASVHHDESNDELRVIAQHLSELIGVFVQGRRHEHGAIIEFHFKDYDDLDNFLEKFQ